MRLTGLHVITDVTVQSRFSHVELCAMAVRGGAAVVQLRDKMMNDDEMVIVAREMKALCDEGDVAFVVNDRLHVAEAVGAGVHVGPEDASVVSARETLGPVTIIGASAGKVEAAVAAERDGASYIGVGHVFATTSKAKLGAPIGIDGLREICAAVSIPVIAIGGITKENARDIIAAGASGIAVIHTVCAAPDPEAATSSLQHRLTTTTR